MEVLFEKLERKINSLLAQRENLVKQASLLRQENEQLRQSYQELAQKIQVFEERLFRVVDSVPVDERSLHGDKQAQEDAESIKQDLAQ